MIWLILILIVLLLAAVLITLLKAWNGVFMVIGGIVVWILAVFVLSELFGDVGAKVGIIGPFAVIVVGAILGMAMDTKGRFKIKRQQKSGAAQESAAKRRAALTALREENRRAAAKEKRKR